MSENTPETNQELEQELKVRKEENRRYAKIGFTVFLTFVACILFFFIIFRYKGFADVSGKLLTAAQPIIVGLVLAYLLNPIMKYWERFFYRRLAPKVEEKKARKRSRGLGVTISILFLLAVIALLIAAIVPATVQSVTTLIDTMPDNIKTFQDWLDGMMTDNEQLANSVNNVITEVTVYIQTYINETLKPEAQQYIAEITSGVMVVVKAILNFLIGIFVAVYVMSIQETLIGQSKKILYSIFQPKRANTIIEVAHKSSDIFGGFITGKLIDSAIIGVICYIGCLILKMPNSVLVAVIIGVTNVIPFFGPFIGAVPALLLVVIQSPIHALYLLIFIIVLQQVDGNIIGPKILGDSTGLSSFWVMFSILVFGGLYGFMGMLLGVPVFAVIYYVVQRLVTRVLNKKGLPTETGKYVHMTRINSDGEMIYEERVRAKATKKPGSKKDDSEYHPLPGDTLHKELQKVAQKNAERIAKRKKEKSQ